MATCVIGGWSVGEKSLLHSKSPQHHPVQGVNLVLKNGRLMPGKTERLTARNFCTPCGKMRDVKCGRAYLYQHQS